MRVNNLFASNLKRLMASKNLRPTDLARKTGKKSQQISRYLAGQEPERQTAEALAAALGASYEELMRAQGEEDENALRLACIAAIFEIDIKHLSRVRDMLKKIAAEDVNAGSHLKQNSGS